MNFNIEVPPMTKLSGFLCLAIVNVSFITYADASEKYPVVDVHTHLNSSPSTSKEQRLAVDHGKSAKLALKEMDSHNVRLSIIMPTPTLNGSLGYESLIEESRKHPGRFAVLGGGALLNPMIQHTPADEVTARKKKVFEERAESILRGGAIGFGELSGLHFSFFEYHPFENSPPDHPLFLLLADIAARHDVPIDIHHELVMNKMPVPKDLRKKSKQNPDHIEPNIAALERLLSHNSKARIILSHSMDSTGHRTASNVRSLLQRHPNLYMSLNVLPSFLFSENMPLRTSGKIDPEWKALVEEFPQRFLIGSDQFYYEKEKKRSKGCRPNCDAGETVGPSQRWLKYLLPETAKMVAYENAERVYRLNDKRSAIDTSSKQAADSSIPPAESPDKPDIESLVSGNTLNFYSPKNGEEMFVFFADNGTAIVVLPDKQNKTVEKSWFVNNDGLLCRTVGKNNKNHCTHLELTEEDDKIKLLTKKVSYQATLLSGNQLPGQE